MKVQIMGAGALGSLFGYLMQRAGYDIVYVARGEQLDALREGLTISGLIRDCAEVNAVSKPVNADVTFVTVKSYDTGVAAKLLAEVDCGVVCSLQNGVGNEEILSKYVDTVVGGVTTYAANLVKPGCVEFAGEGIIYVGELSGEITENVEIVAEILTESKINAKAVDDISKRIWEKAVINAAINPVTALCRVRNGKIVEVEELWNVARSIADEGERVMKAMGFKVEGMAEVVRDVAKKTANNKSSMLQDVERGKRTEIDFINGAIVRKGEEVGVDTPINRTMLNLVKGVERC